MARQKNAESALKKILIARSGGFCEICHRYFGVNLQKHEVITRAERGDVLDPENCLMLCQECHDKETTKKGASEKTMIIRSKVKYESPIPKWLKN